MVHAQDDEKLRLKMPKDIFEAHAHSINNRDEIDKSTVCGCFFCVKIFYTNQITEWVTTGNEDEFAACPTCSFDTVLGDASGYPITIQFLRLMNTYWFNDGLDALK